MPLIPVLAVVAEGEAAERSLLPIGVQVDEVAHEDSGTAQPSDISGRP
jgi:hypothetical protein